ncbi:MAG: hypothetical protein HYZ53_16280 [Planctomycetes bacterium]|nr:hypothetical protein [Planctomycetota bacterium]
MPFVPQESARTGPRTRPPRFTLRTLLAVIAALSALWLLGPSGSNGWGLCRICGARCDVRTKLLARSLGLGLNAKTVSPTEFTDILEKQFGFSCPGHRWAVVHFDGVGDCEEPWGCGYYHAGLLKEWKEWHWRRLRAFARTAPEEARVLIAARLSPPLDSDWGWGKSYELACALDTALFGGSDSDPDSCSCVRERLELEVPKSTGTSWSQVKRMVRKRLAEATSK